MTDEKRIAILRRLAQEWIDRAGANPVSASADALTAGQALAEVLDMLDAALAEVAAAYEAAAKVIDASQESSGSRLIRALTPADAKNARGER